MSKDYRFMDGDKDPSIDVVRAGIEQSGLTLYEIVERCNHIPRLETIQNWLYGDTKKPKNWYLRRVLQAIGIEQDYLWIESAKRVRVDDAASRPWSRKRVAEVRRPKRPHLEVIDLAKRRRVA